MPSLFVNAIITISNRPKLINDYHFVASLAQNEVLNQASIFEFETVLFLYF